MTNNRIVTLKNDETACLGYAILSDTEIGVFESVEKACEIVVTPNKIYEPKGIDYFQCYERFCNLDDKLF